MHTAPDRLETDRMFAERIGAVHLAEICRLHSDADVMRTLSADGEPIADERTRC